MTSVGRINIPSIQVNTNCDGFFTVSGEKCKINVNKIQIHASHRTCIGLQNIFRLPVQNMTRVKQGHKFD